MKFNIRKSNIDGSPVTLGQRGHDLLMAMCEFERTTFGVVDVEDERMPGAIIAELLDENYQLFEQTMWHSFADDPPDENERVWVHPEQWVAYRSGDIMIAPHNGHHVTWDVGAEGTATHWKALPEDPE